MLCVVEVDVDGTDEVGGGAEQAEEDEFRHGEHD